MNTDLYLEHLLQPFGFDMTHRIRLVRHQEAGIDMRTLKRDGWFEFYQSYQGRDVFAGSDVLVSFFAENGSHSVLEGVYVVRGGKGPVEIPFPKDYPYPEHASSSKYLYDLERDSRFDALCGRVVIDWGKGTRSWVQHFRPQTKPVIEVLPSGYVAEFPGYLECVVSYNELKAIVENPTANREWHRMLSATYGIYLILDAETGMQYVGSAYGVGGIIGRWTTYAKSKHGGNKLLIDLLDKRPDAYRKWQFSILQTLPMSMTKNEVIACEQLHKHKLGTRAHGLNDN